MPGRTCWGCGKEEGEEKFQTCARCREEGCNPVSPFCSKECLKAAWPRHKVWHAEQQKALGDAEKDSYAAKEKATINAIQGVLKEQPESKAKSYMQLLMEADSHKLKGAYSKAEELLLKASELNPENPVAFAQLGEIQGLTNKPHAAASYYVKATSLFRDSDKTTVGPNGTNLWASSTLSAIFWLNVPGGAPEERPEWFNDEHLKELSQTLTQTAPQDLRSWQTRAFVLCPMPDIPPQWAMPEGGMMRTEAELQEAGRCWQRVEQMTPGGKEEKRPYVARAAHCFRTAQKVAEQVELQLKAAGQTAETPPAAAPEKPAAKAKTKAPPAEAVPAW
jgi:tetratricopeptide (TPR) repeat protein